VFDLISWRDRHFEGQCVSQKVKDPPFQKEGSPFQGRVDVVLFA